MRQSADSGLSDQSLIWMHSLLKVKRRPLMLLRARFWAQLRLRTLTSWKLNANEKKSLTLEAIKYYVQRCLAYKLTLSSSINSMRSLNFPFFYVHFLHNNWRLDRGIHWSRSTWRWPDRTGITLDHCLKAYNTWKDVFVCYLGHSFAFIDCLYLSIVVNFGCFQCFHFCINIETKVHFIVITDQNPNHS